MLKSGTTSTLTPQVEFHFRPNVHSPWWWIFQTGSYPYPCVPDTSVTLRCVTYFLYRWDRCIWILPRAIYRAQINKWALDPLRFLIGQMCISSISRVFHVSMQYPRSVAGSSPEPGIMSHGDAVYGTDFRYQNRTRMTLTWFEHAAFWSGVRRATVAPRSHNDNRRI